MNKKRWYRINFKKVRRETKIAVRNSAGTLISCASGAAAGFVNGGIPGAIVGGGLGIYTDQKSKSDKRKAARIWREEQEKLANEQAKIARQNIRTEEANALNKIEEQIQTLKADLETNITNATNNTLAELAVKFAELKLQIKNKTLKQIYANQDSLIKNKNNCLQQLKASNDCIHDTIYGLAGIKTVNNNLSKLLQVLSNSLLRSNNIPGYSSQYNNAMLSTINIIIAELSNFDFIQANPIKNINDLESEEFNNLIDTIRRYRLTIQLSGADNIIQKLINTQYKKANNLANQKISKLTRDVIDKNIKLRKNLESEIIDLNAQQTRAESEVRAHYAEEFESGLTRIAEQSEAHRTEVFNSSAECMAEINANLAKHIIDIRQQCKEEFRKIRRDFRVLVGVSIDGGAGNYTFNFNATLGIGDKQIRVDIPIKEFGPKPINPRQTEPFIINTNRTTNFQNQYTEPENLNNKFTTEKPLNFSSASEFEDSHKFNSEFEDNSYNSSHRNYCNLWYSSDYYNSFSKYYNPSYNNYYEPFSLYSNYYNQPYNNYYEPFSLYSNYYNQPYNDYYEPFSLYSNYYNQPYNDYYEPLYSSYYNPSYSTNSFSTDYSSNTNYLKSLFMDSYKLDGSGTWLFNELNQYYSSDYFNTLSKFDNADNKSQDNIQAPDERKYDSTLDLLWKYTTGQLSAEENKIVSNSILNGWNTGFSEAKLAFSKLNDSPSKFLTAIPNYCVSYFDHKWDTYEQTCNENGIEVKHNTPIYYAKVITRGANDYLIPKDAKDIALMYVGGKALQFANKSLLYGLSKVKYSTSWQRITHCYNRIINKPVVQKFPAANYNKLDKTLTRAKIKNYLNNVHNLSPEQMAKDLQMLNIVPKDRTPRSFVEFVHFKHWQKFSQKAITKASRKMNIRFKIHPPDDGTFYHHIHVYNKNGNPLNINLDKVCRRSAEAHIKINEYSKIILENKL